MPWYGVRTICRHRDLGLYEERVLIFAAADVDEALELARAESQEYADILGDKVKSLRYFDIYEIDDVTLGQGTEVYSLMRESSSKPRKYLRRFFDTGKERTRLI